MRMVRSSRVRSSHVPSRRLRGKRVRSSRVRSRQLLHRRRTVRRRQVRVRPGRVRPGVGLIVTAILALVVAACSGEDGGSDPGGTRPSAAGQSGSNSGASGSATSSGAPATSGSATAGGEASLAVLASRDGTDKETPIRVDLNELRVEGRVTRLTFTARNRAPVVPGQSPRRWQITTFFNDGINQKTGVSADDAFSVDGVYLLDPAGAKRYLAARNASNGCVCSGDLGNTFVSPGSGVVLTTLFAALPAGVDSVDVVVPRVGSFNDVAVSR